MSTHTPHTFTANVIIRNLMADMAGDESNGRLPQNFAMQASLAALRANRDELQRLHGELAAAGWSYVMAEDLGAIAPIKNACAYCQALLQVLN